MAARQDLFAIILGCSHSRIPAEIIFDQGLGELLVIRVAGNIVAPSKSVAQSLPQKGSAQDLSLLTIQNVGPDYHRRT